MYGFGTAYGALAILLAIWIYNDAEEHNQDGIVWAIMVFVFTIPALMIYFLFFRQGIAPPVKHKAISRNEDFLIRAKYASHKSNGSERSQDDTGFSDPELDRLIEAGKLSEARAHLEEMVKIAREMNDNETVRNYSRYRSRIVAASTRSSGRSTTNGG